jgi:hypothetical protein
MDMKKLAYVFLLVAFLTQSACTKNVFTGHHAPPGQVKKATGSKSAAPYAPGHQKKKH